MLTSQFGNTPPQNTQIKMAIKQRDLMISTLFILLPALILGVPATFIASQGQSDCDVDMMLVSTWLAVYGITSLIMFGLIIVALVFLTLMTTFALADAVISIYFNKFGTLTYYVTYTCYELFMVGWTIYGAVLLWGESKSCDLSDSLKAMVVAVIVMQWILLFLKCCTYFVVGCRHIDD